MVVNSVTKYQEKGSDNKKNQENGSDVTCLLIDEVPIKKKVVT